VFDEWTILQIDDPIMYHLFNAMHMDLDFFGPFSLHCVSTKHVITLIITPNDIRMMKLDVELSEEVLNPKLLNIYIECFSVLSPC
jgi:hypothetical protein